ncbi:hepatic and glial cell adhesion molecule-like isoform X1 [Heptranchias perlo]|uniref:hepatic and glial cell adhesion molecule-like isoform X1 n=1 Tax=Heptranchias perlo TaxID=212740 RepID=UPI00355976C9
MGEDPQGAIPIDPVLQALCCVALGRPTPVPVTLIVNTRIGETARFPINHHSNEKYEVSFRRRFLVVFKILVWKSDHPAKAYIVHPRHAGRVAVYGKDSVLLRDAQFNDSGIYEIHTDYLGTELRNNDWERFDLRVFEPVCQPIVITSCTASSLHLNCSVSTGTNVTFRWERQSDPAVNATIYEGATLELNNMTDTERDTYTCIVSNPVSVGCSYPVTAGPCSGSRDTESYKDRLEENGLKSRRQTKSEM